MVKNVLILEDNRASMEMLVQLFEELEIHTNVYKAANLEEAYPIVHSQGIDLFVLDIVLDTSVLGDISGIKFAEELRKMEKYRFTPIIFITCLEDPELYAYRNIHSYGYLEKPFLVKETKKLLLDALKYKAMQEEDKNLYFRKDGILFSIKESEIVYVESKGHILGIHSKKDVLKIPYKTCKEMKEVLNAEKFVQCSRSVIVNRDYIRGIDRVNRYIILKDEMGNIDIGGKYGKELMELVEVW